MNKIIIYYAHPLESYGSSQETSDIEFINKFLDLIIKDMNFDYDVEIINPGTKEIQKKFNDWKETEKTEEDHDMRFFKKIIEKCDGLVFRGNTSGVRYEVKKAEEFGLPIWNLETEK